MLKHIAQPVEEEIVTGTDDFIHQRVLQAKGQHAFNFSPSSVVFTSGDRYTSIRQILNTFLSPNMSKSVYQEWHDRQPHGYRYVSPKRPKIGKY